MPLTGAEKDLHVLFLGDNGHHQPRVRFAQLQPVLSARGVKLNYTNNMRDLNLEFLAKLFGIVPKGYFY